MEIHPFRALRPREDIAATVASVPYDVVSTAEARAMASDNPNSFLHVIRAEIDLPDETDPHGDAVYQQAREALERFRSEQTLVHEDVPCLYIYRQIWNDRTQTGVVCCCNIDDYAADLIRKHEKTRPDKEDDRTKHMLSLGAQPGPVFCTYRRSEQVAKAIQDVTSGEPIFDFASEDGVRHTIWRSAQAEPLVDAFISVPCVYIADGHHRAASAWRAGTTLREQHNGAAGPWDRFLTVLFPADELTILPYNRLVADLGNATPAAFLDTLRHVGRIEPTDTPMPEQPGSFGVYMDGTWHRLTMPPESISTTDPIASLDVALLQDRVLEPLLGVSDPRTDDRIAFVGGVRGVEALERAVDTGDAMVAFVMFPTSIEQLLAVADAGKVMPPKSTWFEPKLRSGLFVHLLSD